MIALSAAASPARAEGRALDGAPIAISKAQSWCTSPLPPLPNWDGPANPECLMVWKVVAEKDGRVLYSARYAWPSRTRSSEPLRVLSEVLFEGAEGSKVVRRVYAVQEDETHVRLAPLRLLTIDNMQVVESQICMSGTGECGHELALWKDGRVEPVRDRTIDEIRAQLPKDFDLRMNPTFNIAGMSGSGKVWGRRDQDCCPTGAIKFKLRFDSGELHVDGLEFKKL